MERISLEELEDLVRPVFLKMTRRGLYFNHQAWRKELQLIREDMLLAQKKAKALLSRPWHLDLFGESSLNLDSPLEVKKALAESGNQEAALRALKNYRENAKLVQTYGEAFLAQVDMKSSRIHSTFEPEGTSTGRVASHSPNIQNLPTDPRFQACLKVPAGRKLVQADYSACELRIVADFSLDPLFIEAFRQDQDLHTQVALSLFGDIKYRDRAKAINFGLVYGMGAAALSRSLQISQTEAENLLAQYFRKHERIKRYLDASVQMAKERGFVRTRLGRTMHLNNSAGENISTLAKNMPIQGTAAEIIKLAMIHIDKRLENEFKNAFLVNMIHDELIIECDEEDTLEISALLQEEMESAQHILIPRVKPKAEVWVV